jgi:hypothetical protein
MRRRGSTLRLDAESGAANSAALLHERVAYNCRVSVSLDALQAGLTQAYVQFLKLYAEKGGHRYYGFADHGDPRNYQGPLIWSEGDCQFRFALALEHQFPGLVHVEVPLAKYTVQDYDPAKDQRQFIDIVVSDLSTFDIERDVFAARPHDLFVEVKYVGHSALRGQWAFDSRRKIADGVKSDLERLHRNMDLGRCRAAALLLIDDDSHLDDEAHPQGPAGRGLPWTPKVTPLLASPTQLARREAARSLRVTLPAFCPTCGSPRVAAIMWGMPTPETDLAASKAEVALAGCDPLGDGSDPAYRCLDDGHLLSRPRRS